MKFLQNYTSGQYVWTLIYEYPDGVEAVVLTESEHMVDTKAVFTYLNTLVKEQYPSIITETYVEPTIISSP